MTYRIPANTRRNLPVVDEIAVDTHCSAAWAEMVGDEAVRRCCSCNARVHDLAAMDPSEAEAFVEEHRDGRLFRRPDGRLLTSECPRGQRHRHATRAGVTLATTAGATLLALLIALSRTTLNEEPPLPTEHADVLAPAHRAPFEAVVEDDDGEVVEERAPVVDVAADAAPVRIQLVARDRRSLRF